MLPNSGITNKNPRFADSIIGLLLDNLYHINFLWVITNDWNMEYLNWPESKKKFELIIFAGYWIHGKDDKYDSSIIFDNFLISYVHSNL